MEERNLETMACTSCGESVLSTEKFCKNCGKPLEQKKETNDAVENPNKKVVLTFEALNQSVKGVLGLGNGKDPWGMDANVVYSIEVDGNFIGNINPEEKIETFVTKGKHSIILKRNKSFIPNEEKISVEDNQTILLYSSYYFFPAFLTNPSDIEKKEILQRDKKIAKTGGKAWVVLLIVMVILSLILLLAD